SLSMPMTTAGWTRCCASPTAACWNGAGWPAAPTVASRPRSTCAEEAAMEIRSRFIQADGLRTHYLEAGEGPPLVLVHGGGAGADARGNWQDCIPLLARRFRVLAPDMVGFGASEKPLPEVRAYDQRGRNRHLTAFLQALDLREAVLVGN